MNRTVIVMGVAVVVAVVLAWFALPSPDTGNELTEHERAEVAVPALVDRTPPLDPDQIKERREEIRARQVGATRTTPDRPIARASTVQGRRLRLPAGDGFSPLWKDLAANLSDSDEDREFAERILILAGKRRGAADAAPGVQAEIHEESIALLLDMRRAEGSDRERGVLLQKLQDELERTRP